MNLKRFAFPLMGFLFVGAMLFTGCNHEPECGVFNVKAADLPVKMKDCISFISPKDKVCIRDTDFVQIYVPEIPDLEAALALNQKIAKDLKEAGYTEVSDDRGAENLPYDPQKDPLSHDSRSRSGISTWYEKDGVVLDLHLNLIGLYERDDYIFLNILEESDKVLPSEESLIKRWQVGFAKANSVLEALPKNGKEKCDSKKVKGLGKKEAYSTTYTFLEEVVKNGPNPTIDFQSTYGKEAEGVTISAIEGLENVFSEENRYMVIRHIVDRKDPFLITEGSTFEAGHQYDSDVVTGSFSPGVELGMFYVVDTQTLELLCARAYAATNSMDVTYTPEAANASLEADLDSQAWLKIRVAVHEINPDLTF